MVIVLTQLNNTKKRTRVRMRISGELRVIHKYKRCLQLINTSQHDN